MSVDYSAYMNLVERIEDGYVEIDSDVTMALKNSCPEYAEMWREILRLQTDFPVIVKVMEGDGAISLSADEHGAMQRFFDLKRQLEVQERREIYFRGHADSFAYLKRIDAV